MEEPLAAPWKALGAPERALRTSWKGQYFLCFGSKVSFVGEWGGGGCHGEDRGYLHVHRMELIYKFPFRPIIVLKHTWVY